MLARDGVARVGRRAGPPLARQCSEAPTPLSAGA
ncbi:hypothetical protein BURMUCF2_0554, partial [Burkholderia multivorans CF2]